MIMFVVSENRERTAGPRRFDSDAGVRESTTSDRARSRADASRAVYSRSSEIIYYYHGIAIVYTTTP